MNFRCLVGGVLLMTLLPGRPAAAQVLLRHRFEPNETLTHKVTQEQTTVTTIEEQSVESKVTQTMYVSLYVRDVAADGTATLQQTITRVQLSLEMPGRVNRTMLYDSRNPSRAQAPPGYAELMGAIVGARVLLAVTPLGKLEVLEIPDLVGERLRALPAGPHAGDVITEATARELIAPPPLTFPDGPVHAGDSWTMASSRSMPHGRMDVLQTCTYRGPNTAGQEQIDVALNMTLDTPEQGPVPVQVTLDQAEASGKILWDNRRGELVWQEITHQWDLHVQSGEHPLVQRVRQVIRKEREEQ